MTAATRRSAVTREAVFAAADRLAGEGLRPTLEAVRQLGVVSENGKNRTLSGRRPSAPLTEHHASADD